MKNNVEVIYCGNGIHADASGPIAVVEDVNEAIAWADDYAASYDGDEDFSGGSFDVWESDEHGAQKVYSAKIK
jgi:hypothetical protein